MPATASSAPLAILSLTKSEFIESGYQKTAVVVVDENIYASLLKEKERDCSSNSPQQFKDILLWPGDWHFVKNLFGIIGKFISGSGLEYILQVLYDSSVVNGILGVYNVDRTFRAYTLLYTALFVLQLEVFINEHPENNVELQLIINEMKSSLTNIHKPNDDNHKQKLYEISRNACEILKLMSVLNDYDNWRKIKAEKCIMFKYYDYLLNNLLQPLFALYIATRTNNFVVRNKQWRYFLPFFFAFNHTNYARMESHHIYELSQMNTNDLQELSNNWTVSMKGRTFSSIACDYAIETTQNKDFKGPSGLSGHMDADLRTAWSLSSTWCAEVLNIVDELSNTKQTNDHHIQATPSRTPTDNNDLMKLITVFKTDNPFQCQTKDFYKILSGIKLPNDIVSELCGASAKFIPTANAFIKEHLIEKRSTVFTTIHKGNVRLLTSSVSPEKTLTVINNNDEKLFKSPMYYSAFRLNIKLEILSTYEFTTPPPSFINKNEPTFQQKSSLIPFISDYFPQTITNSFSQQPSVIIVDGDQLL
ncbi:unnamed protein product, partial [Didymodactylos carnosus]